MYPPRSPPKSISTLSPPLSVGDVQVPICVAESKRKEKTLGAAILSGLVTVYFFMLRHARNLRDQIGLHF